MLPYSPLPPIFDLGGINISVYFLIFGLFTGKTGSVMETDENGYDIKDTRTLVIHCEMRTQCVHAKHLPDLKLTSSLSNQRLVNDHCF